MSQAVPDIEVYAALGEQQQALAHYQQALPLRRQVGDRAGEATTLNNLAYIYFQQGQPDQAVHMLRGAASVLHQIGAVAEEAALLRNLAVVLHQALGQTEEAIASVTQSIAILERYRLPQDAGGVTLAEHQALLAQLQHGADGQNEGISLDQLLARVRQARAGDRVLAEALAPSLQELTANPDVPAAGQALAAVLLQLLAGASAPDLNGLPAELAAAIRRVFELPEA